ncbi:MAG TPA: carbonic anhydrase [Solirubrobacteraceae bacterium]|nr:carbonic anhydrase [Solirubrobacteraceae bacterium]
MSTPTDPPMPADPEVPGAPDRAGEPTVTSPATAVDGLLEHAAAWAQASETTELGAAPALAVAIVTCMDCRIDPVGLLGLRPGDAHVMRNAGGVVSDDMLRSLSISQHKLGTREIMLIHHTRCGMQTITDDGFRAELQEHTGMTPPFAIESFIDLDADVAQSVRRVRACPFIPHRDAVRGFVYDIDAHTLREVAV